MHVEPCMREKIYLTMISPGIESIYQILDILYKLASIEQDQVFTYTT